MIKDFISRLFGSKKETSLKEGTVKFFNYKKGYGFITVKDSGDEIFVHTKNLIDKIREKNKVTFTVEKSPKGPIATNVRVVK
ncbi:cold-shock protein [Algibacter pectinivorans]|uniref:Cold shock protein (Beta-ribbon, CspA family) n=1 Tax=Algibacter pectinivorans TaxID=870482 RepID=A0A1I1S5Y3_9FLAO|nr:cold shock domain-containing protein [Algibacter pectinivorans]SFD39978.1 cold shock protein (beta-ribbon, CspA family) [Algibacter pectinivorans]